ncbi:MAG TPA: hypothetical protein ENH60_02890 [Pricia sp.]|nr:hypothetical protein [Pricia sp.]
MEENEEKIEQRFTVKLLSAPEVSQVGDALEFKFALEGNQTPMLLLENSTGPILFRPEVISGKATYRIEGKYTRRSGQYRWQLIANTERMLSGSFQLEPKKAPNKIETYFGPRSIRAGGTDYSMLVIMPTDVYDNPLSEGTQIEIVKQLDDKTSVAPAVLKDGFAWQLLYGEEKAGRMLVGASVNGIASKELTSIISPSNATDFTIVYERVHEFADGNQVISFKTDPITDRFGNVVSDGTLVNFIVTNTKGMRLQTSGTTLAGVATGRMLHPDEADQWAIEAFVTGEAKSQSISVSFVSSVADFDVIFSEDNRQMNIGPVIGFMDTLVPDGLQIQLDLYADSGILLETKTTNTQFGKGQFILEEGFFPNGTYKLKIQLAGLEKEFNRNLSSNEVE